MRTGRGNGWAAWLLAVSIAGCSPADDATAADGGRDGEATGESVEDGGEAEVYVPPGVRLRGTVWGPAPPDGSPLFPVAGALVAAYVSAPPEIPDQVYCEPCVELDPGVPHTLSAADGTFLLAVPPGGHYWLAVQKGQFRRVSEYDAPSTEGDIELETWRTTLPNRTDRAIGDTIPNMAVLYGDYDHIEDLFAKVGIGEDDGAYGYDYDQANPPFDLFDNGDQEHHGADKWELLGSIEALRRYHIVFFNCSYNAIFRFMRTTEMQDRIRQYVAEGGRIYVSDYAMPVVEKTWPDFLWFMDPLHGGCNEADADPPTCNHGPPFDAASVAADEGLHAWLDAQGLLADGFETRENWDTIGGLFEGVIGTDPDTGLEVRGMPKIWVEGPWDYDADDLIGVGIDPAEWDATTVHPFTVSFQYGCGRVLFTTYHTVGSTTGGRHPGLYEQELTLFYLIMEIGVCQDEVLL